MLMQIIPCYRSVGCCAAKQPVHPTIWSIAKPLSLDVLMPPEVPMTALLLIVQAAFDPTHLLKELHALV